MNYLVIYSQLFDMQNICKNVIVDLKRHIYIKPSFLHLCVLSCVCSWVWAGSLNMSVLGVHCAQLCARLTMEGRVQEAQRQLKAQQDLLKDIRYGKPPQTALFYIICVCIKYISLNVYLTVNRSRALKKRVSMGTGSAP